MASLALDFEVLFFFQRNRVLDICVWLSLNSEEKNVKSIKAKSSFLLQLLFKGSGQRLSHSPQMSPLKIYSPKGWH